MAEKTPILLSGMQPSGDLMIGNLIGALRNWVRLQDEYDCLFVVVDLHAITVPQEPKLLRKRTLDLLCLYLAAGVDPERSTIFVQSHVPAHTELAWLLGCHGYMGELGRMTQFKDKSRRQGENIRAGLFFYPVLMASDILLYDADLVPVGDDQRQHLELTRDLAERFNNQYGATFTVPKAYIPEVGARIMSLTEPENKMSKSSENPKSYIALLDPPDVIRSKIKKAVTDSGTEVRYDPVGSPAISNLLTIHGALTGEPVAEVAARFSGKGYGEYKQELAEAAVAALEPIQTKFQELRADKAGMEAVMAKGAEAAHRRARRILDKVKRKIGFVATPRV
jgi:tryptophanyl-tRNA synthetase